MTPSRVPVLPSVLHLCSLGQEGGPQAPGRAHLQIWAWWLPRAGPGLTRHAWQTPVRTARLGQPVVLCNRTSVAAQRLGDTHARQHPASGLQGRQTITKSGTSPAFFPDFPSQPSDNKGYLNWLESINRKLNTDFNNKERFQIQVKAMICKKQTKKNRMGARHSGLR